MPRFLIALIIVLLTVSISVAQDEGDTPVDPQLQQNIERIESNTEIIRGLQAKADIAVAFPTRADLREFLTNEIAVYYTPERVEQDSAFYVAFDFLPPDFDIPGEVQALYQQQVAGYYDPDTQTMNVILTSGQQPGRFLPLLDRIIYAHEYTHALQDQYFDLAAYQATLDNSYEYDRNLALQALIEGDATAVMNEYARQASRANPLGAALQLSVGGLQSGNFFLPPGTPTIFAAEILFVYYSGEHFVLSLFAVDGWETVNNAFSNPPQSTEHILHPQTYLDGDNPIPVTLDATVPGDDWHLLRSGTMGEFYLRQFLDTHLEDDEAIAEAAAGWGGDTYHIYRNSEGALAWELRLVWDTEDDAGEFMGILQEFIAARLPDSTRTLEGPPLCYTGAMVMCVNVVDAVTIDLTSAPSQETALAMID